MDNIEHDWVPREGMNFNTLDDAWDFWKNYGRRVGFNFRKHYANKSKKDNVITFRRFLCSKEGYRGVDKRDHLIIEHRSETRTGCPVRMGIMLNRSTGQFFVHEFVSEHNHILRFAECAHMMGSKRKIADVQAIEVQLAADSGLKQKNTFEFLGRQSGGRANLGFLQLDQKNYLRSKRQREMAYGEVGCLLRYFQNKTLEDPSFFMQCSWIIQSKLLIYSGQMQGCTL
ncbi:Protein FAR1-RELATED SEQUENCE 7 [Platanthera zijinensis]|uniref:Protein FAR1-RELATED SEQUENCE 7 n=1 Tax=Platanthera zijinensis TaxID=2320716 RepID=A0AAP0G6D1_9ASPA